MANIYALGIEIPDGGPHAPALSFISDPSTGLYLNHTNAGIKSLGIAFGGSPVALFGANTIELMQNLKISAGATDQSLLVSDPFGTTSWKVANANGVFRWNSLFAGLDFTQSNYSTNVSFPQLFLNAPSISLSKESGFFIADNFDNFVTNKTTAGFTAYSNTQMFKTLVTDTVGDYNTVRLSTGGIGVVYVSLSTNRVTFVTIDAYSTIVSTPLVIDTLPATGLCSTCMVGLYPAIVYTVYNSATSKYEWRYTIALDVNGLTWRTYSAPAGLIYSTTVNITALPISLFMVVSGGVPLIILNTEVGAVQLFKSADAVGTTFGTGVQVSNLSNHQILMVQLINGFPSVLVKSSAGVVYYVQSTSAIGAAWPIGATQIFKSVGGVSTTLNSNANKLSTTIGYINATLCIIVSEATSNTLWVAVTVDPTGVTWGLGNALILNNTPTPFTSIFQNNGQSYMIYNNTSGVSSKMDIVQFSTVDGTIQLATDPFINTLTNVGNNLTISNQRDGNNSILINGSGKLILVKFFGNDFNINWIAVD